MPGSFDDILMIDSDGRLAPRGPTGFETGEKAKRLDIWVFQKGAYVAVVSDLQGPTWTVDSNSVVDHLGAAFEPGPAIAMGLMVYNDENGVKTLEQWSRAVMLKRSSC